MRFLKYKGVRIVLGFILSNIVFDLFAPNIETNVLSVILRIIVICFFYYMLTLYVNSKR